MISFAQLRIVTFGYLFHQCNVIVASTYSLILRYLDDWALGLNETISYFKCIVVRTLQPLDSLLANKMTYSSYFFNLGLQKIYNR